MNPVIIINDPTQIVKKTRLVEVYKNNVFKTIETITQKHIDASGIQDVKVKDAIAADNAETLDGAVIARYVEFRDAQLRRKLMHALVDEEKNYANDEITMEDNRYRYLMSLPESFKDNVIRALAEYFHRFLAYGALYDWYSQFGMAQAAIYGRELDEIEEAISDTLRGHSIAKRPLQPFGPANKLVW